MEVIIHDKSQYLYKRFKWTCDECGELVDKRISIGEKWENHESARCCVCKECLLKAIDLIDLFK